MSNHLPRPHPSDLLSSEAVLDILKLIFAGAPLREVLTIIVRLVEAQRAGMLCAIWFLDKDGAHFHCAAAPNLPAQYIAKVDGVAATPNGTSCGAAVHRREPVYVTNILTDPLWDDYRDLADAHGLRACWSHPLLASDGKVLGTFANYYREPRSPSAADVSLIENASHIVGIAIERHVKEERLRESEFNLRRLTETIPEMLWSATPDGAVDYCNSRLLDYTGLAPGDVMGQGWTKLLHPDDVEPAARAWAACVATGAPYRVEVRTFCAADRSYRWCVTSALPLRDARGTIIRWHGTVVDMHDWKQAQDALRNTQAELANMTRAMSMSALTASIAHEVNQPLAGIVTNASTCLRMLDAAPPNIDGARETARRTIRDGNRASEVISRLRALFSRKQTASESVDLNEATREVIALLASKLQKNRIVVRRELADDLPPVIGDRVQFQQVIMNLLQNAAEAMSNMEDRPRRLLVCTEREPDDRVRFSVEDTGPGFDPNAAARLFDAFYTTKTAGMGIGLCVSRSIIESHHGRIWAQLNSGPGATFSFSVPRRPERAAAVSVDLHDLRSPAGQAARPL